MKTVHFTEHKFKREGKYKCVNCGYRFKRTASTYWTENPFNKMFLEQGSEACNKNSIMDLMLELAMKDCPKCGQVCTNIIQ
jgi:predicted RNA-binding Zn-ribbon protein involved in translation (DUF1610 family)